jgi:hypothetical protein
MGRSPDRTGLTVNYAARRGANGALTTQPAHEQEATDGG